jgi:hypothetical protein
MNIDSITSNDPDEKFFTNLGKQLKRTPGSLHLTHTVMCDDYSGDEVLHVTDHMEIINNYVYINGNNTGINVKGEKGDKGDPGDSVQSDWNENDSTSVYYIQNKPLKVSKTIDPETGEEDYSIEFL